MCEVCGKRVGLNAHHIVGKDNRRTRYDLQNGACLCACHHILCNEIAHKNPVWFYTWMIDNREEDWDYLVTVNNEITKRTAADLADLLKEMEQQLRGYSLSSKRP